MPTFPQLTEADKILLLNKFNQLGLNPPPSGMPKHDCRPITLLGRIKIDGKRFKDVQGCKICGKLQAACGRLMHSTTLSAVLLSCIVPGGETIEFLPTEEGKEVELRYRNLEIGVMLEDLKTDHASTAEAQMEQV